MALRADSKTLADPQRGVAVKVSIAQDAILSKNQDTLEMEIVTERKEPLAVGPTESLNAFGAEVRPEITSDTSVDMTGGPTASKEESHAFRHGGVSHS